MIMMILVHIDYGLGDIFVPSLVHGNPFCRSLGDVETIKFGRYFQLINRPDFRSLCYIGWLVFLFLSLLEERAVEDFSGETNMCPALSSS